MPKIPAPYSFPLRSRAAIADFLDRDGRCYHYTRFRFVWNVKAWQAEFDGDTLRKHYPDLSPAFDARWDAWKEENGEAFWDFCEDAARHITEDGWRACPADDQGDWEFEFAGRSGGWLVLKEWYGRDVSAMTRDDFLDRDQWPWADLVAFYRGITVADYEFTEQKAAAGVEYQAAFRRECLEEEWTEERDAETTAMACAMAAARPDLAPTYA